MKKRFKLTLLTIILLIGCCSCKSYDSYQRNSDTGFVLIKSYENILNMKLNEEEFLVLFTMTTCPHCSDLHQKLKTYLDTHHVVINEVILDINFDDIDLMKNELKKDFPNLNSVPTIYFIKGNRIYEKIVYNSETFESELDLLVQNYKLDQ